MPYCFRLLQIDILPQKLSRRKAMDILPAWSGVAWISTGTLQVGEADGIGQAALLAEVRQRDDDAVDLGGVLLEERGALLRVLIGLDCAVGGVIGLSTIGLMPAASSAAMISSRPLVARCEGKNPRLPTRTPMVICLDIAMLLVLREV